VAHAQQILTFKPKTLAHEENHHASSIHHHPEQLNQGEARGDQGKTLGLLLGAREAWVRSCDAVEAQKVQVTTASLLWIIFSSKS
jgi:hypothetical protein